MLSFCAYLFIIIIMDLFSEGQKLTLFFQKGSNMVEMTCVIEQVFDDRLSLQLPQYFMRYIEFLQVGKEVTAKAFSKLGAVDFNTIIISSPLEDYFTIEIDYNSVNLTTGNEIAVVKAVEHLQIVEEDSIKKVKTFELSTEYLRFYSDKKYAINDEINGILSFPRDYGTIKFKGYISEIDPIYENEHTLVFATMTEKDRQTLLYYMYMYSKNTD